MRLRPSPRVASRWSFSLLVLWAGCTTPDPAHPSDASRDGDEDGGSIQAFYACTDTAQCVAGTVCTNWGSGAAYCRPLCASTDECADYPYPNLRCQPVVNADESATEFHACNDGPRTVLVTRSTDGCSSSSSCGACTPRAGCGWCGATSSCRAGTRSGPSTGACVDAWAWVSSECPDDVVSPDDVRDEDVVVTDAGDVLTDAGDVPSDVRDVLTDVSADRADARDGCAPSCLARSCGPDGCGGSCGTCGFSRTCTDAGRCTACVPDCEGRNCGPDGCGGTCGSCYEGSCSPVGVCSFAGCGSACRSVQCGDGGTSLGAGCSCGTCRGDQVCVSGRCVCPTCPGDSYCHQTSCCRPDCTGRVCGSDGCNGSCGECVPGLTCNAAGRCVCVPNCTGRVCGSDGCGGSCGACTGAGEGCTSAGACCATTCSGRRCGPNGCGGTCGTCAAGQSCNESTGQCSTVCVPNCTGRVCGSNGCGGSCGVCGGGLTCTSAGLCASGGTCTDNGRCVTTVRAVRGASCGSASSLDVTVRNSCTGAIAIQLCLTRSDGTCNCGLSSSVAAGATMSYYTCASTGAWSYRAGATSDVGSGCFPSTC